MPLRSLDSISRSLVSSNRRVIVAPPGQVLSTGDGVGRLHKEKPSPSASLLDRESEACPETLRSPFESDGSVYAVADRLSSLVTLAPDVSKATAA